RTWSRGVGTSATRRAAAFRVPCVSPNATIVCAMTVSPRRPMPPRSRRQPGELATAAFLEGLLDAARARLPEGLREGCNSRQQGSLGKLWYEEPQVHYEVWLHRARMRVELGLHFETRDPAQNAELLGYLAEELVFLKAALGDGLEAEPWDKGWCRVYLTLPLEPLLPKYQARLAEQFALLVETLEPLRPDAVQMGTG